MIDRQDIWKPRTDLALELTEDLEEMEVEDGISMEIHHNRKKSMKETIIRIKNERGKEKIGKPEGTYITIEGESLDGPDENYHEELSLFLAKRLAYMLRTYQHILTVGLGNHQITSDSLGPSVVDNLSVTRHLQKEGLLKNGKTMSAIIPGVMGQTGMEASEIIKGVVEQIHPDAILLIDALAARNVLRLHKTIQICDTGIIPGAGVGNHRREISGRTMGIPVISMGVPTVISVPTIVNDALSVFTDGKEEISLEKYISPQLADMFVTPKNVDEAVKKISFTISEAIHQVIYEKHHFI